MLDKTRNGYSYRYPAEVGPRQPLQTEFWIPKGRKSGEWRTDAPPSKTWRKVRPNHSHKDKLPHSMGLVKSCGYAADRDKQCEHYCDWARNAGLKAVTVYRDDWRGLLPARALGLAVREVDPADFIGSAPTAEECEDAT